jgi:hypothetical protein
MKHVSLIGVLLVTCCAGFAVCAQEAPEPPAASESVGTPAAEVEPRELWLSRPPAHEGGAQLELNDPRPELLPAAEKAVGYITVRNAGDAPLVIERVRSTCGCTVAQPEVNELAPGEETRVKVEVNPLQVGGFSIHKQISIHTNDPAQAVIPISIRGEIFASYEIVPEQIDLGVFEKGEEREASLILRGKGDTPITIDRITTWPGSEGFEVDQEDLPADQWESPGVPEYRITFRATPLAPAGQLSNVLLVTTTATTHSTIRIPVQANILSFYTLSKKIAFVGPGAPGTAFENVLEVHSDSPLELVKVESSLPEIIPSVRYSEDRTTAFMDFTIAPGAAHGFRVGTLSVTISANGREKQEQVQLRTAIHAPKPQS